MKRRRRGRSGGRRRNTTQRDLHFEANHHPPLPSFPLPSKQNSPSPFPFSILGIFGRHRGPPPPELQKKNGPGHKRGGEDRGKGGGSGETRALLGLPQKHINSLSLSSPVGLGLDFRPELTRNRFLSPPTNTAPRLTAESC